jgi:hypothetical protein
MKNRWWLTAGLVWSLGLTPLALAQEGKTGVDDGHYNSPGIGGRRSNTDKDAMKSKDNVKDTSAVKDKQDEWHYNSKGFSGKRSATDKDAMKSKDNVKDTSAMKDKQDESHYNSKGISGNR